MKPDPASPTVSTPEPADARRPYVSPVLTHLGDVRSITLNGGNTVTDNPVFARKMSM